MNEHKVVMHIITLSNQWRWVIVANNNHIIAGSKAYWTKSGCMRAAKKMAKKLDAPFILKSRGGVMNEY